MIKTLCITLFVFILTGCSKENEKKPGTRKVRYEIITTSTVISPYRTSLVNYTISPGKSKSSDFSTGTRWEQTTTVDNSIRLNLTPLDLVLETPGSATATIYVDDKVKATTTSQSRTVTGLNTVFLSPISFQL